MNVGRRTLYKHLDKYKWIQGRNEPLNDFTKPISRIEWELLSNKNKKKYNRFAMANNIPVYERTKNGNN